MSGQHTSNRRALLIALAIAAVFLAIEVAGGLLSGSLALLADAGHMATDVAALGLAFFALRLSERGPTPALTYGYRRTEILAALANGVALAVISLYVVWEAVSRIAQPHEIETGLMLIVALAGLAANLASGAVLYGSRHGGLNMRGAFLHVAGDALASVGAIAAALVVRFTGWTPADALVAIAIAGLILTAAWRLVRESVDVLMEATPGHVDIEALKRAIREVPGVVDLHDLHVWTLMSGYHAMSAHVDVQPRADGAFVLRSLSQLAQERFGIDHTTFQLERHPPLLEIEGAPGARAGKNA